MIEKSNCKFENSGVCCQKPKIITEKNLGPGLRLKVTQLTKLNKQMLPYDSHFQEIMTDSPTDQQTDKPTNWQTEGQTW